jgi:hypothetical protein
MPSTRCAEAKYSAAHYFRQALHNDDQPRTKHAGAERTERHLLPELVAEVIERQEARRRTREATCRANVKTAQAWHGRHKRMAAGAVTRAGRVDLGVGRLELRARTTIAAKGDRTPRSFCINRL